VTISKVSAATARMLATAVLSAGLSAVASAHHSYAMYDASIYKVFTGVMVRVVPNAAHFEMHFVPLNEERTALVRDEKGEPLVWVVQMESAARAYEHGITRESFPQGTVVSMGVHPRRDGKPAGDRGESGLFQCPKGKPPAPGKHCDSVEGSKRFGEATELPPEGPVVR
jgi:uncharacterized protein DUF6152